MDPGDLDASVGLLSPLSSVDVTSRDRAVVTEGEPLKCGLSEL